ncbi:response regulator [Syntrophorhabdus aromaticivorans]|uniref:Response regulator n=1 Tax=Syntrophorhabdus aromaticivorans TaxID=328301 RepID=A0A971M5J1_9BACT|nr:response regulator [Syntrophorhabdus aromaticivorans]NLW36433.1 response regulator [Syntrophorhabdus aromaticivorans]
MEKKVLLIDDEASLRRSVTLGLMQKGYETEPCENGMKALQTLEMFKRKKIPLDYAIVDVRLPDIDGLKLLKVIKFNYPGLPVIVITGYGSEAVAQEVKTEQADGYLEKPFSMEDLARVLDEIPTPEAEAATPETEPVATPAQGQSTSTYALVSLNASADLMKVYRKLYFQDNVLYCDAVRGEHDLVLLLQGDTQEALNEIVEKKIKAVEGVEDVVLLPVQAPVFGENVIDIMGSVDKALGRDKGEGEMYTNPARIRASSYVMLEIEKEKLESIYPVLYFNDQVVYCDYTRGKYDVVLLMKGTSFSHIEETIRNKFKPLDGVLRIKEWPIITLFDL